MLHFIGVDEAGFGPNLGPLVVTATAWTVESPVAGGRIDHGDDEDLYRRLEHVVSREPVGSDERIAICDSKRLYKPGGGLSDLERPVLSLGNIAGLETSSWRRLLDSLDTYGASCRDELPWYQDYDANLPLDTAADEIARDERQLREGLARSQISVRAIRSALVHPREFNRLTHRFDSKGAALTHITLQLVNAVLESQSDRLPATIVCDKHGGRNKYAAQLQEHFPERLVLVRHEGRAESHYVTGAEGERLSFYFRAKGESFLPSALASMVSKYARELCMRALNTFWVSHQPGLKPTAGYPVDAKRFKSEIADVQRRLTIDDELLWRAR